MVLETEAWSRSTVLLNGPACPSARARVRVRAQVCVGGLPAVGLSASVGW